jgi:type I site-specific restriction endonuclease
MTNCNVLTTGFDLEALSCIILASPTKSKVKYIQMIGRAMRVYPGKEDCLILDMKDTILKHDILDMSDVFGVDIQNGETLKEAQIRTEEEIAQAQEEKEARELAYLQEQELIAQEIELFNSNISNALEENSYFDWWKVNKNCYALSQSTDFHYLIESVNGVFNVFQVNSEKDHNQIDLINSSDSVLGMISFVEEQCDHITSFMRKDASWKFESATPAQLRAIKWGNVSNKMDCHIYFSRWKIGKIMEKMAA